MTDSASTTTTALEFAPYVFFGGRTEEALEFYKSILGGSFEVQRNSDTPMGAGVPENWRNKVMHARFTAPGVTFMASDGREAKTIDPEEGNVSLTLTASEEREGKRIFDALSKGGKVKVPFDDAPWGNGKFGMLDDPFGIEWMVATS